MFQKAQRKRAKLRLALCGPSGSGKTYSSLLIARGLAPTGKIAMIDTERGSGELYSNLLEYDVATLTPPFAPERYIQLIREAEQGGYDVLIIDNLSHAWAGQGGVLEMHDKAVPAAKGNTWAAWRDVTPTHNALVDAMLNTNMHVITTMRTKTAYEVVDENGKKKPIKIGLAPVQREGMEYEFTVVLDLTVDQHIATAAKDRTSLLDGKHFIPTVETGQMLAQWLDSGYDAEAASHQLLEQLSKTAKGITDNDRLTQFWRDCVAMRQLLTTEDLNTLTGLFKEQKAKILAAKETGSEDQAPSDNSQADPTPSPGGSEGRQNIPPGAPNGAPSAPVGSTQDQSDEAASEDAVAELFSYALEVGITPARLAAYVSAATKGVTSDLAGVSKRVLDVVRKQVEKVMSAPKKPQTITGDIIPDGYAVDQQAHIFDPDALDRGEFIEA